MVGDWRGFVGGGGEQVGCGMTSGTAGVAHAEKAPALDCAFIEEPRMNFTLECEPENGGRVLAERPEHAEVRPIAINIALPAAA